MQKNLLVLRYEKMQEMNNRMLYCLNYTTSSMEWIEMKKKKKTTNIIPYASEWRPEMKRMHFLASIFSEKTELKMSRKKRRDRT